MVRTGAQRTPLTGMLRALALAALPDNVKNSGSGIMSKTLKVPAPGAMATAAGTAGATQTASPTGPVRIDVAVRTGGGAATTGDAATS